MWNNIKIKQVYDYLGICFRLVSNLEHCSFTLDMCGSR